MSAALVTVSIPNFATSCLSTDCGALLRCGVSDLCRLLSLFGAMNFSAVETVAEGLFAANSSNPTTESKVDDSGHSVQSCWTVSFISEAFCPSTCPVSLHLFWTSCLLVFPATACFFAPLWLPAQNTSVKSPAVPVRENPPKLEEEVASRNFVFWIPQLIGFLEKRGSTVWAALMRCTDGEKTGTVSVSEAAAEDECRLDAPVAAVSPRLRWLFDVAPCFCLSIAVLQLLFERCCGSFTTAWRRRSDQVWCDTQRS